MSDAGPSAASVAALVEAIEARARQAGSESASSLLRGMLGSVSEVLGAIQDRLDHVEDLLTERDGSSAAVAAVQEGLAAFHTRLGRLEEAFVQAVDDSGSGTRAVVDEIRTVVEEALAAAPPPAHLPPAELHPEVGRALDVAASAPDRLEAAVNVILDRLDAMERSAPAPTPAPAEPAELDPEVRAALTVAASTPELVERAVATILDRLRETAAAPEVDLDPVVARLIGLEQLVRLRGDDRPDPAASVRAALAPFVERLDALELMLRGTGDTAAERFSRLDAGLAALPARLAVLEQRLSEVADAAQQPTLDPVVSRLEDAIDQVRRDEGSAHLVRLVEERLAAGMRAMTERADAVGRAVEALADRRDDHADRLDALGAQVRDLDVGADPAAIADAVAFTITSRLSTVADRLDGLDARLDAIDARLAGVDDGVAAVHGQLEPLATVTPSVRAATDKLAEVGEQVDLIERATDGLGAVTARLDTLERHLEQVLAGVAALDGHTRGLAAGGSDDDGADDDERAERIAATVRREAELLTQRVASLAVGVEAARALLEQHVADTEQSVGRKATEFTRRVAADFGIRTKGRTGGRRDPRELGPG
jgi:hypothetical protein